VRGRNITIQITGALAPQSLGLQIDITCAFTQICSTVNMGDYKLGISNMSNVTADK